MIAPASRKVGKYEILRKLGRGGMADVYLAQDSEVQHEVALKLIEHGSDIDSIDAIEAERRGAVLQARLAEIDPRVVRIYDCGDADGFFYVAMEYIDGQDLSELLRRGPLPPVVAADVALAVAQTLEHAHSLHVEIGGKQFHGIVHGDIKPKNIRVDSRDQVRVLDFGIAKALSQSRRLTRNEFGSVPYGSPERLESGQVNEASDLWSLAVMLYEMVTGLQPYHADSTERLERMIRSHVAAPPPPEPCPEMLRHIVVRAMSPNPDDRYQTAAEFAAELRHFRNSEGDDHDDTRRTSPVDDSTRRTAPPLDETRRTLRAKVVFGEKPPGGEKENKRETWPPAKPLTKSALMVRRAAAVLTGFVGIWIVWSAVSSVLLYRHAQALEHQIATEELTNPDEIWKQWTDLAGSNPSSWLLYSARKAVEQKLVGAADHVLDNYRNSNIVYEAGWKGARDELSHVLLLDPNDSVRGKLRVTEGHLARINGSTHQSAAELNDAAEKFTEAEKLLPKSPDPELGLARVYFNLNDIDRAYQALQEAEKRGYTLGNREKTQLAEGYRDRGDRTFWESRNVRGLPQERDEVERAKADLERALELYKQITPYNNAAIKRVQQSVDSVNFRLALIEGNPDSAQGHSDADRNQPPGWLKKLEDVKNLVEQWQSRKAGQ